MSLRIVLIGNAASTMVRFRGPLIKALMERGHEVIAICPSGTDEENNALATLGIKHIQLDAISRQGLNPLKEFLLLKELITLLQDIKPDRVFSYFLKPAIWGTVAAKRAGVPRRVAMIEGMGYAFSNVAETLIDKMKQAGIRQIVLFLLSQMSRAVSHLIVLNRDDAALLKRYSHITDDKLTVLDGIGIDLEHFFHAPPQRAPVRFVLAARLIKEKGIELFCACAARVRAQFPDVQFRLLGGLDDAPGALSQQQLDQWVQDGGIEWRGMVSDVRPHLIESSVFVLPTLYREGLPRSTMEAMAMGRPVITSDMPGARDSVTHGVSGFIHSAGDLDTLVEQCLHFCKNPDDISSMGSNALIEARRRYAIDKQNQRQIDLIVGPVGTSI